MPLQTAYDQIEQLVHKFKALSTRERNAYNEAERFVFGKYDLLHSNS